MNTISTPSVFDRTHAVLCEELRTEAHEQMRTVMTEAFKNYPTKLGILLPISRRLLDEHNIRDISKMLEALDKYLDVWDRMMHLNRKMADPEAESMADLTKFFMLEKGSKFLEEIIEFKKSNLFH
jgi:hypothetical protein